MTLAAQISRDGPVGELARGFVASYFSALKRDDLARLVLAGEGEDFAELTAASELLAGIADKIGRYETALAQYRSGLLG